MAGMWNLAVKIAICGSWKSKSVGSKNVNGYWITHTKNTLRIRFGAIFIFYITSYQSTSFTLYGSHMHTQCICKCIFHMYVPQTARITYVPNRSLCTVHCSPHQSMHWLHRATVVLRSIQTVAYATRVGISRVVLCACQAKCYGPFGRHI